MKWFGIDYRYVIAAVGAVFILWYEGSAPVQEEPQAEQAKEKPQPTQSNIEALKGINDKLAELLKNHRDALEDGRADIKAPDGSRSVSVKLSYPERISQSFSVEEKKYFGTFLLGLTCVETPSYFDYDIDDVNYDFYDGEGTQFDSVKVQMKACRNFNAEVHKQNLDRDAWAASGRLIKSDPKRSLMIARSGTAVMPEIAEEEGYESTADGFKEDGTLLYTIKHLKEQADQFDEEAKYRIKNGSLNGVCLNSDFRDRLNEGFPGFEIRHVDKDGKPIVNVFISETECKKGRPDK